MTVPLKHTPTLLITLSGPDKPGITWQVFENLAMGGVEVLDVEQVVVRGHLTLAILAAYTQDEGKLIAAANSIGKALDLKVKCQLGKGDTSKKKRDRLAVSILTRKLTPAAMSGISQVIAEGGGNIDRIRRVSIDPLTTIELEVSGRNIDELRADLQRCAAQFEVDIAVSPGGLARRGKRLVVMDVDSTLIHGEVIEMLAAHAGTEEEVAAVTERAMAGELDFAESLHARVATLKGIRADVFDEVREQIVLTPGARTLCRTLKRLGFKVALVSGGFEEIVRPLAKELDIDYVRANTLEIRDGLLTGKVTGAVIDRAAKATALREFAAIEGLPLERTVAVGDGANDLDMLAIAGLGIAFNAKPVVRKQAKASVNLPYLDSVLYMLGISREEVEESEDDLLGADILSR